MKVILIGMKASGKSTVGRLLAKKLQLDFIELDNEIEKNHWQAKKERLTCREIFKKYGAAYFCALDQQALQLVAERNKNNSLVLSCGGSTPLNPKNLRLLKQLGQIIFLDTDERVLLPRILKHGRPAFFSDPDDPAKSLLELMKKRRPIYSRTADQMISFTNESPAELVEKIIKLLN